MTGLAAVRYGLAVSLAGQRWVAPAGTFAVVALVLYSLGGDVSTTLAVATGVLFPVTAWLAASLVRAEPLDRLAVATSIAGGVHRARATTLVVALVWAQALVVLSLAAVVLYADGVTPRWLVAAVLAHEAAVLGGAAVGALCAPPVVRPAGWGLMGVAALSCADLVVPHALPARTLVDLLAPAGRPPASPPWASLVGILVVTAVAAPAVVAAVWTWAQRRA